MFHSEVHTYMQDSVIISDDSCVEGVWSALLTVS